MRRVLLVAFVLFAALGARAANVTLVAPQNGAVLRGGTTATVEWSAPLELPEEANEWEAFLSADDGAYYAYRITPHLSLDHRRFTFEVPNVDARRARLLLRVGDERRETEIDIPVSFAIERDATLAAADVPASIADHERGEPARPGEPGVIEWIDGDRDGGHLQPRNARTPHALNAAAHIVEEPESVAVAASSAISLAAPQRAFAFMADARRTSSPRVVSRSRAGREVLLVGRRLNV
ncbi:MAG: hypothetical protein M3Q69_20750 [Acidobacteriota bacterium]|nr:hypothetical protein [Acidobacteriota bacterium]